VRRARARGAERWCYLVDADAYARWVAGTPAAAAGVALPAPGGAAARARGCLCVRMATPHARGAFVVAGCPVHGALVAEE
jgi:hypothetical protein